MPELEANYDCIVMGGGPAGSTTAALIAEAGFSTLLVERETMPRPHVGESLMPETYWVFERLGVLDQLKSGAYAKKVGVQFVNNTGKESAPFFFRKHDDRESSETWHVERADFDQMLFENAASKGATCCDATRVKRGQVRVVLQRRIPRHGCPAPTGCETASGNPRPRGGGCHRPTSTYCESPRAQAREPNPPQSRHLAALPRCVPRRIGRWRQNRHYADREKAVVVLVHPSIERHR